MLDINVTGTRNVLELLLHDSGDQTRCFTYVDDAIAGTLLAGRERHGNR